ncbi:hypothetical protein L0156_19215 [bacterium]|nr:hypothetical protein [bacterium]
MTQKKSKLSLYLLICLLITSTSNSLVMMETTAKPEHKKELLQDLQSATGLWLDVRKNFVRENTVPFNLIPFSLLNTKRWSLTARFLLLGALRSNSVYRVRTFRDRKLGSAGSGIDLNINDLKRVTYRSVPREAFGAGLIFLHELAHSHRGLVDPDLLEGRSNPEVKGPTVEYINKIQRELGLPERLHYFPKKIAGRNDVLCIYFGTVERVELDPKLF